MLFTQYPCLRRKVEESGNKWDENIQIRFLREPIFSKRKIKYTVEMRLHH